jgi:hypothetical protein
VSLAALGFAHPPSLSFLPYFSVLSLCQPSRLDHLQIAFHFFVILHCYCLYSCCHS